MAQTSKPGVTQRVREFFRGKRLTPEVGYGGAKITGGILKDEHVAKLQGKLGRLTAAQMRRSEPQVRAVTQVISLPIRSTPWYVEEPEKPSAAEKEAAELLRTHLFGGMAHSFDDLLREACLAIYYGFRTPEICWEERAGAVAIEKIAPRNPELLERWLHDPDGRLVGYLYTGNRPRGKGLADKTGGTMEFQQLAIPMEKTLHFVYDGENDSPEGFGLWRSMYQPYFIKSKLIKVLAVGIERNYLDVPVGKLGSGAQADERNKLMEILSRWRAAEDAAVVLTDGQELEFKGNQRGLMDAMPFLHYLDFKMAITGLCTFLNLGQSAAGTQALGSELVKVFLDAEQANANWIEATLNSQLVRRWCRLNYGEGVRCPQIRHKPIRARDAGAWAQVLNTLVTPGFLHPTVEDEEKLREELELPAIPREQLVAAAAERKAQEQQPAVGEPASEEE